MMGAPRGICLQFRQFRLGMMLERRGQTNPMPKVATPRTPFRGRVPSERAELGFPARSANVEPCRSQIVENSAWARQ